MQLGTSPRFTFNWRSRNVAEKEVKEVKEAREDEADNIDSGLIVEK